MKQNRKAYRCTVIIKRLKKKINEKRQQKKKSFHLLGFLIKKKKTEIQ